ncbi:FAD-binding protein [Candidatus Uhrbacteria bacterium]|nr:FAD-binding protein [Candidatus Uhrbacteria bacterium]
MIMFDCVIVGGGPAGLAAAVYLARQKLSFIIVTGDVGGQALWSDDVENYLGFHLMNGIELVNQFKKHLEDYKDYFALKEGEEASKIEKMEGGFRVATPQGLYETKTVLIATGTKHRVLGVPGEKELYGKGVTYCANCDSPLYKDKTVYVIGGGNSAMDAALFVEKYATRVVMVSVNAELQGDAVMKAKIAQSKKINVYLSTKTTKVMGSLIVTGIGLMGPDGKEYEEKTDGVFIEIGLAPVTGFIDFVAKDTHQQIIVDKMTATNVEGVWAAGDVTDVTEKQISVAVGEGSKGALAIIKYLQTHH